MGLHGSSGRSRGQRRTFVLLDGHPLNDPCKGAGVWTTIPVEELERIEVVRGPFPARYGGNAMGGVIQILTRPVDLHRFGLRGEYGPQETSRYGARLADDWRERLGVSVSYERPQSGGDPSQLVAAVGTLGTGDAGYQVRPVRERLGR